MRLHAIYVGDDNDNDDDDDADNDGTYDNKNDDDRTRALPPLASFFIVYT